MSAHTKSHRGWECAGGRITSPLRDLQFDWCRVRRERVLFEIVFDVQGYLIMGVLHGLTYPLDGFTEVAEVREPKVFPSLKGTGDWATSWVLRDPIVFGIEDTPVQHFLTVAASEACPSDFLHFSVLPPLGGAIARITVFFCQPQDTGLKRHGESDNDNDNDGDSDSEHTHGVPRAQRHHPRETLGHVWVFAGGDQIGNGWTAARGTGKGDSLAIMVDFTDFHKDRLLHMSPQRPVAVAWKPAALGHPVAVSVEVCDRDAERQHYESEDLWTEPTGVHLPPAPRADAKASSSSLLAAMQAAHILGNADSLVMEYLPPDGDDSSGFKYF